MWVTIDYTNWRGVRSERRVQPMKIVWENNEWHPATQWIMYAVDEKDAAVKAFAMKDIHSWRVQ